MLRTLRLGYVVSAIAFTTLFLYPWLAAARLFGYRHGLRLVPKVYHCIVRALLGMRISIQGAPSSRRPLLLVANHTSWLDIVVISSFVPAIFVAKQEVEGWPIFGWLAQLQRSIFVNRDRRQLIDTTISLVADALVAGEIVAIFPEGTSTDGTDVFPFRSALIGAARETLRKAEHLSAIFVQPLSIAYVGANRRLAVWAREDEIPIDQHVLQVIGMRRIEVTLKWGDPIPADIRSDRMVLAKQLEEAIRQSIAQRRHEEIGCVVISNSNLGPAT